MTELEQKLMHLLYDANAVLMAEMPTICITGKCNECMRNDGTCTINETIQRVEGACNEMMPAYVEMAR
jgi:hypothetical protein